MKRELRTYYTGFGIRFELNGIQINFIEISNFSDNSMYTLSDKFKDKVNALSDKDIMAKYPECFI